MQVANPINKIEALDGFYDFSKLTIGEFDTLKQKSVKELPTRTADGIGVLIEDYRRDDGSGVIKVKRDCGFDLEKFKANADERLQDFCRHYDKKLKKKMGWDQSALDEYRKDCKEIEKEKISKRAGKRGKIRGFSAKSKKKLMDDMQMLDYERLTVMGHEKAKFVTLTYPRLYPDLKTAKRHLDNFLKRIKRKFPKACAIWKMELQKRGAPHFHLIFFKLPRIEKETINEMWGEVVGVEYQDYSPKALEVSRWGRAPMTGIESIKSIQGIIWYTSKYISKKSNADDSKTNLSEESGTALLNSAPNLTAKAIKENFNLIEEVLKRAHTCGENICIDHSSSLSENQQFGEWVGVCVAKYAFPHEKEILMPSCGRVWGKFNAKEVDKKTSTKEPLFIPYDLLQSLKRFAKNMRGGFRINNDSNGFTFYVNNDCERQFFNKLINAGLCGVSLDEGAPF